MALAPLSAPADLPPALWFHADTAAGLGKLVALWPGLVAQVPGLSLVLSFPSHLPPPALGNGCTLVPVMRRRTGGLARVLAQARPRVGLFVLQALPPSLLALGGELGCPVLLADAQDPRLSGLWGRVPGMTARMLRKLARVFVPNDAQAAVWVQAGLPPERVRVVGNLNDAPMALPCNEAERDALADALRQRSVWLAAAVPEAEEGIVIAALRETLRESHRAVLILNPANPERGPALKAELAARFATALRSVDDPITPETQVYNADTEGEQGLWYRLAVACYLGGTLGRGGALCSPFDAAGLGCAIVHGREVGRHTDAFARLQDAQATRRILRPDALGRAMCMALRPDSAAALANRAWQVVTDGAEASEAVCAALLDHLRPPGGGRASP